MTDIDFEELDKAVNSLMGKAVPKKSDEEVKAKTLTISSTLKPGERPAYDKLEEVAKKIGSETLVTAGERTVEPTPVQPVSQEEPASSTPVPAPAPVAPAAKRPNSGRFMDVVHPSSDMRTSSNTSDLVVPERSSATSTPQQVPAPKVVEETSEPSHQDDDSKPTPAPLESPEQPPASTSLTPFLPNAKVEKRPLGGDPTSSTGAVPSPFDEKPASDPEKTEPSPEPVETTVINNDTPVDSKEGDDQRALDATNFDAEPTAEEQTLQTIESAEVVSTETLPEESVRAVESGDTEKLSSGSITKQYQEKASDTSQPAGAIYDVNNYHQPLGHPAKQKSGWSVVLIIALIIVICAALAAAAYFILGLGV